MPRGDGTGPAGGGGRRYVGGRGMGRGRGRGRGQGQCVRQEVKAGVKGQVALLPARLENEPSGNAMPVAYVDEDACTPCGACQAVCPAEAITLGEVAVSVDVDLCCGCGACVEACPNEAIRLN